MWERNGVENIQIDMENLWDFRWSIIPSKTISKIDQNLQTDVNTELFMLIWRWHFRMIYWNCATKSPIWALEKKNGKVKSFSPEVRCPGVSVWKNLFPTIVLPGRGEEEVVASRCAKCHPRVIIFHVLFPRCCRSTPSWVVLQCLKIVCTCARVGWMLLAVLREIVGDGLLSASMEHCELSMVYEKWAHFLEFLYQNKQNLQSNSIFFIVQHLILFALLVRPYKTL